MQGISAGSTPQLAGPFKPVMPSSSPVTPAQVSSGEDTPKDFISIGPKKPGASSLPTLGNGIADLPPAQQQIVMRFVSTVSRLEQSLQGVDEANEKLGSTVKAGNEREISESTTELQGKLSDLHLAIRDLTGQIEKMNSLPDNVKNQFESQLQMFSDIFVKFNQLRLQDIQNLR